MSQETIKRLRPFSLVLFFIGCVAFVLATLGQIHTLFFVAALVTFSSAGFFLFTEAFLFTPPERTRVGIWIARFFFILSVPVVLGIAATLFRQVT